MDPEQLEELVKKGVEMELEQDKESRDDNQEAPSGPPPFDEAACEALRQACVSVIQDHPEVRSVAATVDYYGALNDAVVQKGIWLGEEGVVTTPDAILGSTMQTLRLLEEQIGRLFQVAGSMKESLQVLGEELVKKSKEVEGAEGVSEEKLEEASGRD
jgi:hypothetical protein